MKLLLLRGALFLFVMVLYGQVGRIDLESAEVTAAMVMDPLYPHGSSVWGPSPRPGQAISPSTLGRQFVPRRMGTFGTGPVPSQLGGKYVLVLPYEQDLARLSAITR